jgi:hypothetical protein
VVECEVKVKPDHIISDIYRRLKRLEDRADAAEFGTKKKLSSVLQSSAE